MTGLLEPRAIGRALTRRDGQAKVTGTAPYAVETRVEHPAYCHLMQATSCGS
jgi:xanthine dehydrogenase YagR molybdenum-binding subunit